MEPKEKQVRKVLEKVHGVVQRWWPWAIVICMVAMGSLALTGCRCTAAAYGTQRTTKDSVAVRYRTVMKKWFGGKAFTFPLDTWQTMLDKLSVYASEALNVTERHKAEVQALTTIEEVEAYDITKGYPDKLTF